MTDSVIEINSVINKLHPSQKEVVKEYLKKQQDKNFTGLCLSLPMGFGKTIIALTIALTLYSKFLIVCSKTVITSWISEINKFFDKDSLKYEVVHRDFMKGKKLEDWKMKSDTQFVITTAETIKKSYKSDINNKFAKLVKKPSALQNSLQGLQNQYSQADQALFRAVYGSRLDDFVEYIDYQYPTNPFGTKTSGVNIFHGTKWDAVIVDECQNYTNIQTNVTRSIASLCTKHRILLSGTLLQEVSIHRILGLFLLFNLKFPRNVVECKNFIRSPSFKGINQYCIVRKTNPNFTGVKLKSNVVNHRLSKEEAVCYSLLREIVISIFNMYTEEMKKKKDDRDNDKVKKLGGHLLAMITYLRQAIIIPPIAISQMITRIASSTDDMQMIGTILTKGLQKYNLKKWLDSKDSSISTRMNACINTLLNHMDEVTVVFGNYLVCMEYLKKKYEEVSSKTTYILSGDMSIKKRQKIIDQFNKSDSCVLFLTYCLGAEGLNLQHAKNVIHLDSYWNRGKEDQAVTRVFRMGQLNPAVNQYYLISNTKLEEAMLYKQKDKLNILNDLKTGNMKSSYGVTKMSLKDIVKVIDGDTNFKLANMVKYM
jgi:SNF2 family DNA or RNA helicase